MMRSPGDPDPTPADRSKPESSATNCSVDCVWDSRDFGSGSGGLAALVETHERNRSLQSASSPCDHRLSEGFGGERRTPTLTSPKVSLTWEPAKLPQNRSSSPCRFLPSLKITPDLSTSGELAAILPAPRSQVSAWLQQYQTYGVAGLLEGYRCGRPPALTD